MKDGPGRGEARELLGWNADGGVVSVYLGIDPADRGGGWRTRLGNGLERLRDAAAAADHRRKVALRATADRLAARFDAAEPPFARGEVGFVEVAERPGRELWRSFHLEPRVETVVAIEAQPVLAPLLDLSRRARPRAVALVSAERLRLFRWAPGEAEQLADWELTLYSDDWRERKAQRPSDPAGGHGVSASGHDQFDQRLAANRERFLHECGGRAADLAARRDLVEILGFGPAPDLDRFREGVGEGPPRFVTAAERDLITLPAGDLDGPVAAAIEEIEADRDRELAERTLSAARSGGRGSAGLDETAVAAEEGRVEHLLLDRGSIDGAVAECERLIRRAVATDAAITCVSPAAGGVLADAGGVAALLRY